MGLRVVATWVANLRGLVWVPQHFLDYRGVFIATWFFVNFKFGVRAHAKESVVGGCELFCAINGVVVIYRGSILQYFIVMEHCRWGDVYAGTLNVIAWVRHVGDIITSHAYGCKCFFVYNWGHYFGCFWVLIVFGN